jgi:ABC-type phosphate/phosphonate transport system substrate-binding protein
VNSVILVALALGLSLGASPPAPAAEAATSTGPRTLAVVPFYTPERMWQLYSPFVEHLRRETGEPWELVLVPDHAALDQGLCAGKIDVALIGPIPLARLNRRCGAVPVLVPLGLDGVPAYRSVLLTTDPAVTSVAALRGKEIAFFKGSTAAHLVPARMLADAGLGPGDYQPVFLESQDRLMTALLARRVSAAGVKSALFRRFEQEPGLRLLETSAPLPNFCFAALPARSATRERFLAALQRLRPAERAADAALVEGWDDEVRSGFVLPPAGFLGSALDLHDATEQRPREPR